MKALQIMLMWLLSKVFYKLIIISMNNFIKKLIKKFKNENYNDKMLKKLITKTESMDDFEKKWWLENLEYMEIHHKKKLFKILLQEKIKLKILDKKYDEVIKALNEQNLLEWQGPNKKERIKELKEKEKKVDEELKKFYNIN